MKIAKKIVLLLLAGVCPGFLLGMDVQDTVKTSLPIHLKAYLSHPQSQDSDLEITLLPVTGWWRFWYRSPYRYEIKWQHIK